MESFLTVACNFQKKKLHNWCFLINFAIFFEHLFQNSLGRLFLFIRYLYYWLSFYQVSLLLILLRIFFFILRGSICTDNFVNCINPFHTPFQGVMKETSGINGLKCGKVFELILFTPMLQFLYPSPFPFLYPMLHFSISLRFRGVQKWDIGLRRVNLIDQFCLT